ncbi:MAG: (deoxy)nucleoside triphosphate pyrophosphohydrolase [Deltaproteobacteria bacterium]|nr:(deoxy)nucleoside triphosphate pyrophosphohydrolase [Deltaproteobacteria bacterium]
MEKKTLHVVCLVMRDQEGFIFAAQRPPGKKLGLHWEFPGGKVEPGEHPESALRREISEELLWNVGELERLPDVEHEYDFGKVCLIPFLHYCKKRPNVTLTEHLDSRWVHHSALEDYTWAPADIPIIGYLLDFGCAYE